MTRMATLHLPYAEGDQLFADAADVVEDRDSINVTDHLDWSRGIARGVSRAYRFDRGSQEESDLEQTAMLALVRCGLAFDAERVPVGGDPAGAFRGYAHRELQSECRREARRLRNGGTYRTRREQGKPPVVAGPTSDLEGFDGERFDVLARASEAEEPDDDFYGRG